MWYVYMSLGRHTQTEKLTDIDIVRNAILIGLFNPFCSDDVTLNTLSNILIYRWSHIMRNQLCHI